VVSSEVPQFVPLGAAARWLKPAAVFLWGAALFPTLNPDIKVTLLEIHRSTDPNDRQLASRNKVSQTRVLDARFGGCALGAD
jgi:hypothetical protein